MAKGNRLKMLAVTKVFVVPKSMPIDIRPV
jgi:hypothetical protein